MSENPEYPDRWKTNKRTGQKFPVNAGRLTPQEELARLQAEMEAERQRRLTTGEISDLSPAQLDRIIRKADEPQPAPGTVDIMIKNPPIDPNAPQPVMPADGTNVLAGGTPIFDNPQPVFGNEAPTIPGPQVVDPEEEAKLAGEFYEKSIVDSASKEELDGWKQDIAGDTRLTHGERARYMKLADEQKDLLGVAGSDSSIAKEAKAERRKERKEEKEDDDGPQPLFGNTPLFGGKDEDEDKESKTKKKKHGKHSHEGIFGNEPLF